MNSRIPWLCLVVAGVIYALSLLAFETVTIAWDANTETNLTGYAVHYGTNSREYGWQLSIPADHTTQSVILPFPARWFFAVTAEAGNLTSGYSAEITWDFAPAPPLVHGTPGIIVTPRLVTSSNLTDWQAVPALGTWFPATNPAGFFKLVGLDVEKILTPQSAPAGP